MFPLHHRSVCSLRSSFPLCVTDTEQDKRRSCRCVVVPFVVYLYLHYSLLALCHPTQKIMIDQNPFIHSFILTRLTSHCSHTNERTIEGGARHRFGAARERRSAHATLAVPVPGEAVGGFS